MNPKTSSDIEMIASLVQTALLEGLKDKSVSTIAVVIGVITGAIYTLTKKGIPVEDIIAIYQQHSIIFGDEIRRKNKHGKSY